MTEPADQVPPFSDDELWHLLDEEQPRLAQEREQLRQRGELMENIRVVAINMESNRYRIFYPPGSEDVRANQYIHDLNHLLAFDMFAERTEAGTRLITSDMVSLLTRILLAYPMFSDRIFDRYRGVFNTTHDQDTPPVNSFGSPPYFPYSKIADYAGRFERVILALPRIRDVLNVRGESMPTTYGELEDVARSNEVGARIPPGPPPWYA